MKRILKIIKYLGIILLVLFLIFTFGGLIIKNKGQNDINKEALLNEGGKLALDQNDRKIEYFTYGSTDTNAIVVINIHGSGLDGTFEKLVHQNSCNELNVKGISISFFFLNVIKAKDRDWNLFISGAAAGISFISMLENKFW